MGGSGWKFETRVDGLWLHLAGDVDLSVTPSVSDEVLAELTAAVSVVRVEASEVSSFDSTGVELLVRIHNQGCGVIVVDPTLSVLRMLERAGLMSMFELHQTE